MSANVIPIRPLPDFVAQAAWQECSEASDQIAELIDSIPETTVRGDESRAELAQARDLLRQAVQALKRTDARESGRWTEELGAALEPAPGAH